MHPKYIATAIAVALGAAVAIPAAVSADQHMAGATMEQRGDALSTSGLQAERRNDMDVPNNAGKEIGEVEKVSRHNGDNELYSIVLAGGFLDISDRYIALPLGQTEFRADKLVANDVAQRMPRACVHRTGGRRVGEHRPKLWQASARRQRCR